MTPSPDATLREPVLSARSIRIDLPPDMRLAEIPGIEAATRSAAHANAGRIVLDARRLRSLSRGAYLALVSLTVRLERGGIELIVVR